MPEMHQQTESTGRATTMAAVVRDGYGSPDVLRVEQVERPTPGPGEVLVRVEASTVQPFEWHTMTGEPWLVRLQGGLRRPKIASLGTDVAGTIVDVAADVSGLAVGDRVWGFGRATLAEYAVCTAAVLRRLPDGRTAEEGAALGIAALTALEALDRGGAVAGSSVLVNGASGGVGTFAVQIATDRGARVTGVCSGANVDLVSSLGADEVVDYTTTDVGSLDSQFDVIIDNQGSLTPGEVKRLLVDDGRWVIVGGPKSGRMLGPAGLMLRGLASFVFSKKSAKPFIATISSAGVDALSELFERRAISPVIGHRFELADVAEALGLVGSGHAKGKVVITV